MEIEGFMSTSIKKTPCWPFISNTFVEIEIPEKEIDELNDNYNKGEGFCFLDDHNKTYAKKQEDLEKSTEMECLFNPLNIFQIVEVEEDKEVKNEADQTLNVFYAKLKYIVPDLESETNPVSDELKKHFQFQHNQKAKIQNQGDVFFLSGDFDNTIRYYDDLEKVENPFKDGDGYRKRGISLLKVNSILNVAAKDDFWNYFQYCQEMAQGQLTPSLYYELLQFYDLLNEKSEEVVSGTEKEGVEGFLARIKEECGIKEEQIGPEDVKGRLKTIEGEKEHINKTDGSKDRLITFILEESQLYERIDYTEKSKKCLDQAHDILKLTKYSSTVSSAQYKSYIQRSIRLYKKLNEPIPEHLEEEISKLPTMEKLKKGEKFIISQKTIKDYE